MTNITEEQYEMMNVLQMREAFTDAGVSLDPLEERSYAAWIVAEVIGLCGDDQRCLSALEVARLYACEEADEEDLRLAAKAAKAALRECTPGPQALVYARKAVCELCRPEYLGHVYVNAIIAIEYSGGDHEAAAARMAEEFREIFPYGLLADALAEQLRRGLDCIAAHPEYCPE